MNYEKFKTLLSTSKIRMSIMGGVFALVGIAMTISLIVIHETKVAFWIMTGLFLVLGFPILILSLRDLSRIRSGTLPLLKAINEHQKDYIVWIYNNEVISNVSGVAVGKSSNIVLYDRHGKTIQVILGKKASLSADAVVNYLASEFPDADTGYSDQTREAVGRLLNKKV